MDSIEAEFEDLKQQYYPGTKKKIPDKRHAVKRGKQKQPKEVEPAHADWAKRPKIYRVGDEQKEFFTIGALAAALHREPVTIRMWERTGIIPLSRFRTPNVGTRAGRRLYTREQIEGIVKIAKEEGVLSGNKVKNFTETNFTSRVIDLFQSLGGDSQ